MCLRADSLIGYNGTSVMTASAVGCGGLIVRNNFVRSITTPRGFFFVKCRGFCRCCYYGVRRCSMSFLRWNQSCLFKGYFKSEALLAAQQLEHYLWLPTQVFAFHSHACSGKPLHWFALLYRCCCVLVFPKEGSKLVAIY